MTIRQLWHERLKYVFLAYAFFAFFVGGSFLLVLPRAISHGADRKVSFIVGEPRQGLVLLSPVRGTKLAAEIVGDPVAVPVRGEVLACVARSERASVSFLDDRSVGSVTWITLDCGKARLRVAGIILEE